MENEYLILIHNLGAGSNGFLGEFNNANKYEIKSDIKDLLKKTNKLITEYKTDRITAVATVGSYTFNFVVYVQLGEQNKKRLTLFFVENGKILDENKEYLTLISSVIIDGNVNIIQTLKKEFNMYIQDESAGIDMSNANLIALADHKDSIIAHSKFLQKELIKIDKAYVLKTLALIKASSKFGTQFLLQFKSFVKAQNLDKSKDSYWSSLKKILDKMLNDNSKVFDGKLKQHLDDLQAGYIHLVKNMKEAVIVQTAKAKKKVEEKKKQKPKKKKPDAKKNSGKASSSNGAKTSTSGVDFGPQTFTFGNVKPKINKQYSDTYLKQSVGFYGILTNIYGNQKGRHILEETKRENQFSKNIKTKQDQGRDM